MIPSLTELFSTNALCMFEIFKLQYLDSFILNYQKSLVKEYVKICFTILLNYFKNRYTILTKPLSNFYMHNIKL